MTLHQSLAMWSKYGRHVLMASPYKDQVITEARGCTVVDADGNSYLDLTSGQICAIVGHNHPELVERVIDQIRRVVHTGTSFFSPVVLQASERLAGIAPGNLSKCLFLSTGAEANEYALRLAKACTGRDGVLAMTKGYAGLTLQTSSLTNYGKGVRPIVPGTGYLLVPDPTRCPRGRDASEWSLELLDHSLELNRGLLPDVAAIIVEPILSAGGLIVPPPGYLKALRRLANELGALLIADEAQTGLGRTGRWFGVDHEDVVPDILVLAKGVGGGFPSSAVLATERVADLAMVRVNQFSSHQSDPLGAAATLAVIDIIERERLIARAEESGTYLQRGLTRLAKHRPQLINVRGKGLMVGFDVVRDPGNPVSDAAVGRGVEDFCRSRGVNLEVIQRNRFRILPPLTISTEEIDRFLGVLDDALAAVARGDAAPVPPSNEYAAEYDRRARGRRGIRGAAAWAWQHSPSDWFARIASQVRRG